MSHQIALGGGEPAFLSTESTRDPLMVLPDKISAPTASSRGDDAWSSF